MELTQDAIYEMAPFAKTLGVLFPVLGADEVRADLGVSSGLSTTGGGLHGGAIMSVCDLAAAVLVGLNLPDGSSWTTAESTSYFLRPVVTGGARATARPIKLGRSVLTVEVEVVDHDGHLCARTSQLLIAQPSRQLLRMEGQYPAGMTEQMVRLRDGAELWTAVSGTGPPVVLLHGGPGLWDYLAPLAALLDGTFTVIRFDQRGCGRSSPYAGSFTIAQAVDDMDQVRVAYGLGRWAVAGHSWGAELAVRYAAEHSGRTTAIAYIAGIGAGNAYRAPHAAEFKRRLQGDYDRWAELSAIPARDRTPDEDRECCLLQWGPDFSPSGAPAEHARALWDTRPPGASINETAHRQLWADRGTEDLCRAAARVTCPVTMICGADDPRPWTVTGSLLAALPDASRIVFDEAGHSPWAERPADTARAIADALSP